MFTALIFLSHLSRSSILHTKGGFESQQCLCYWASLCWCSVFYNNNDNIVLNVTIYCRTDYMTCSLFKIERLIFSRSQSSCPSLFFFFFLTSQYPEAGLRSAAIYSEAGTICPSRSSSWWCGVWSPTSCAVHWFKCTHTSDLWVWLKFRRRVERRLWSLISLDLSCLRAMKRPGFLPLSLCVCVWWYG